MARIPIIHVEGQSMPEAWENAYLALADRGLVYKRDDPDDSGDQVDSRVLIDVQNPDSDPFSHRKGGTNANEGPLYDYLLEMMGARDSWVKNHDDPEDKRWEYMYHERLAMHPAGKIDQIEFAKQRVAERPFSRRTNLITWYPGRDTVNRHTPCLQRIWFHVTPGLTGENDTMEMHYEFRSNNVVNASFGNMLGLYVVGCDVRDVAETQRGKPLDMRLIHSANSFHVNAHDYKTFLAIAAHIRRSITEKQEGLDYRTFSREDIVDGLKGSRQKVEDALLVQTAKTYSGDLDAERQRVHAIGDRIFYLLDKYAPKQ